MIEFFMMLLVVLVGAVVGYIWGWRDHELKEIGALWNQGYSSYSGEPWVIELEPGAMWHCGSRQITIKSGNYKKNLTVREQAFVEAELAKVREFERVRKLAKDMKAADKR